uniref:L1 transposable element RRM domain-containing protein n=1 Tax=Sus scrofa TaxID=9823 RepID=A0A8D0VLA6_PIG
MLKMMQDIRNKLEAKMDNSQETLSKDIQDIKLKQEEMQNTITEIKNSLEAANSRIQEAEERISKVEDRLVEIMDVEQKREKRLKTNEESLRDLWDRVKINPRRNSLGHILIKLTKIKDEKILKAAREKKQITYKRNPIRLSADFSAEILQARREWHDILNMMKGKKPPTKTTLPSKVLIQI